LITLPKSRLIGYAISAEMPATSVRSAARRSVDDGVSPKMVR
jgi:hypothetical protein